MKAKHIYIREMQKIKCPTVAFAPSLGRPSFSQRLVSMEKGFYHLDTLVQAKSIIDRLSPLKVSGFPTVGNWLSCWIGHLIKGLSLTDTFPFFPFVK